MFKWKINFTNKEDLKIKINDFGDGLYSWENEGLSKNTLSQAENMIYTITWTLKRRKKVRRVWGVLPDGGNPIVWIWGSVSIWKVACIKNSKVYLTDYSSLTTNWTALNTGYSSGRKHNIDIFEYYCLTKNATTTLTLTWDDQDERFLKTTSNNLNENEYVWQYVVVWNEIRLITSNTSSNIYINWIFDKIPTKSSNISIYKKEVCLMIIWAWRKVQCIRKNDTDLVDWKPGSWSKVFGEWGVVEHNRLFYFWKYGWDNYKSRVYFSILWIGVDSSKYNYIDVWFEITGIKAIRWQVVVYWENNRARIMGDNPDNFYVVKDMTHQGAISRGSIANWNNQQFYLSKQGIEVLEAVDTATPLSWLSISEKIKEYMYREDVYWTDSKFNMTDCLERSHWEFANGKYFLNIWNRVIVYDISNSLILQTNLFSIFNIADETGISQAIDPDNWYDVVWQWTHAKNINNKLYFWIWWNVYYYSEDGLPYIFDWKSILATVRFNWWNRYRKKIFKRIKQSWSNIQRTYTFNVYLSCDWWAKELVHTTTDKEYEIFINKQCEDIRIITEITTSSGADREDKLEHLETIVFYKNLSTY